MAKKKEKLSMTAEIQETSEAEALPNKLIADLVSIIENRKQILYRQVNSNTALTFWEVGKRTNEEILGNERAEYGKQITVTVSQQLQTLYGKAFEHSNLTRMMKFSSHSLEKSVGRKI